MMSPGKFVDDEENISDVKSDVTAFVRIEDYVAHSAFPHTVEIKTDKITVCIDYRTS